MSATKWWVYLCTNFNPSMKTNSCVALGEDPVDAVERAGATADAGQRGALKAGDWRLEIVIGPFAKKATVDRLAKKWRNSSRGITSRRKEGYKMFARLAAGRRHARVEIFDADR
jgi:hypothetical protein